MACSLTSGRDPISGCGATKAGLDELKLRLIDRSNVTFGAINTATGVSTTVTVAVGAQLWPFAFDSRGFSYSEEMTTDANTGAQTHKPVLTGRLIGLSGQNRADVEKLKGTNLVAIQRTKAGKYLVFGRTAGLTLDTNTAGSAAENLGEVLTLSTTEDNPESEKYFELLITSEAATEAALVLLEEVQV